MKSHEDGTVVREHIDRAVLIRWRTVTSVVAAESVGASKRGGGRYGTPKQHTGSNLEGIPRRRG